jgi:hypothetical protein
MGKRTLFICPFDLLSFIYFAGFGAGTSTAIAITGHTVAQVPHDMHFAGSILHFAPSAEIAITGQIPIQV